MCLSKLCSRATNTRGLAVGNSSWHSSQALSLGGTIQLIANLLFFGRALSYGHLSSIRTIVCLSTRFIFLQNSLRSFFLFTSPWGRKSSVPDCSRENLRFLTVLDYSDESASGMSFTSGCISPKTTENHSPDHLLYLFLQEQQPSPEQ